MAEEILSNTEDIDLEIDTVKTPEEALEVIGEDTNLQAILLELYIAHTIGDTQKFKGMIEAVREGRAGIDWAYKKVKAELSDVDTEGLDF